MAGAVRRRPLLRRGLKLGTARPHSRGLVLLAVLAGTLCAVLGAPAPVLGHAELVSSDPAPNARLLQAPGALSLTFTERIDPGTARIRLLDSDGADVANVAQPGLDEPGTRARLALPSLQPGVYTVDYQVTSAVDGHVTRGSFAFLVDPTGTQPAPATSSETGSLSSTPETTAARWVGLAAILGLAGAVLFWLVSARPALAAARHEAPAPWAAICLLALAAVGGMIVYLLLAARPLPGGGGAPGGGLVLDPAAPFGTTQFANAMRLALVGAGAAALLAIGGWITRRAEPAWLLAVLATAVAGLTGLSAAGHAAANGGLVFAALDLLHLLGVAAWIGTLVGALLLAYRARGALSAALWRHSRLALGAAPVVVASGIANSTLVLGDAARDLVASDYGNLLLGKVLLFAVAVAIGAANFFLVRRGAFRLVVPLVALELAAGTLAVAAAAGLVTGQPAAGRVPVVARSGIGALHLVGAAGESNVHAAINLPVPGEQRYQVSVTDPLTRQVRTDVQRVFLEFRPPRGSGLPAERVQLAASAQPGLWGATGTYTPLVGEWELEVVVRRRGELDETIAFGLPVAERVPAQQLPPPDNGITVPRPLATAWSVLPSGWPGWIPAIALFALAALLFRVSRRRGGRLRTLRIGVVALAVLAGVTVASRELTVAANAPPAVEASRANPVGLTAESVARGGDLYRANCSSCHGLGGAGDGPGAAQNAVPLGALSEVVPSRTDGWLAYRIAVGTTATGMPAFGATLSAMDRWDLVNYLRAEWGSAEEP